MQLGTAESAWKRALSALGPIDRARGAVLSVASPIGARTLLRDRGLRVVVFASLSIVFAFGAAWLAPMALLALGPIALGVPHLLADVRYLIVRPRFHRRAAFWLAVIAPLSLVYSFPRVWVGLVASLGAVAIARTTIARKITAGIAIGALAVFAHAHVGTAEIVMAHAHNLVALAMWALFFRSASDKIPAGLASRSRHVVVLALFLAATLAIFLVPLTWPVDFHGTNIEDQIATLAPLTDWDLAARIVIFFAFAQSVHYAVWLRAIPDEARPRAGLRSFASSAAAMKKDVGLVVLALFALTALAIATWALVDLVHARTGYLRLATSHGYVELAVAALFVLERRRPV